MTRKKAIAAVDRGEASFAEWFEAQYGKRPSKLSTTELREKLDRTNTRYGFEKAAELRHTVTVWEMQRDTALKSWQAARRQKS